MDYSVYNYFQIIQDRDVVFGPKFFDIFFPKMRFQDLVENNISKT